MFALSAISYAFSILIMPLLIKFRLFVDFNAKRTFYTVYLFGFLRVNSGYISVDSKAVIFHYSDKKAFALSLKSMLPDSGGVDVLTHFNFTSVKSDVLIGGEDSLFKYMVAFTINSLNAIIFSLIQGLKRYTDYKCNVFLSENNDAKGLLTNVSIVFNLICLTKLILKGAKNGKGN